MNVYSFVRMAGLAAILSAAAMAADVTGKWVGKMETPNGSRDVNLTLKQDGEKFTGAMSGRQGDTPISDGSVKGDDVAFSIVRSFNGNEMKMNYKGNVEGGELKMKFQMRDNEREITFKKAE